VSSLFVDGPLPRTGQERGYVAAPTAPSAEAGLPVTPAAVLIADLGRRILHVEGGAFAVHSLEVDGWIGQRIEEVLPSAAGPMLLPRYEAALGGEVQAFQYRSHDGTRIHSVQLVPVPGAEGAISSVVAVMQDLTDHVRVTSDLARSEGRLREAERMVGVGSWELVMATGEIT
jgi:PAS domain-containing protein